MEIRQLVFEGTYDAYKWDRVGRRQREFDASLFGALLPHEAWERAHPTVAGRWLPRRPRSHRRRLVPGEPR